MHVYGEEPNVANNTMAQSKDVALTLDAAIKMEMSRTTSLPLMNTFGNIDDMKGVFDGVSGVTQQQVQQQPLPKQSVSRQDKLYELARQTAGLSQRQNSVPMPSIRESQSVDSLPYHSEQRRRPSGDFKPVNWLNKSVAILPEAYMTVGPSQLTCSFSTTFGGIPRNIQRSESLNSNSSLLEGFNSFNLSSNKSAPSDINDSVLDHLLNDYVQQQQQVVPPMMPFVSSISIAASTGMLSPTATSTPMQTALLFGNGQSPISVPTLADLLHARSQQQQHHQHRSQSAPTSPTLSPSILRRQSLLSRLPLGSHISNHSHNNTGVKVSPSAFAHGSSAHPMSPLASSSSGLDTILDKDNANNVCANCGITKTVLWRLSKLSSQVVCNACGLYENKHNKPRPPELNILGSPMKKRVRRRKTAMVAPSSSTGAGATTSTSPTAVKKPSDGPLSSQ